MSKRAWWLGAAAAVIVLPAVAVGIAVAVLDPNDYKPQIAAAVLRSTGRVLSLDGPLRISRSLWPTIDIADVKLANLPGGSRPDMARAERIEAQLSLPALLRRRIEVVRLTLTGPNILFEQVGGQPNWVFHAEDQAQPAAPAENEPVLATTLRFRAVHVQNGLLTLRLPGRANVVGVRSLDLRHAADEGPLSLGAVLVYADNQPFGLQASAQPTGATADPWRTRLHFDAYDTAATATGTMALSGAYDLQVDANSGMLEKLNALLPQLQLPPLRQASLSTHLVNGKDWGDLPVVGATRLHVGSADLGSHLPGLTLGAVDVSLLALGDPATVAGMAGFAGQTFKFGGSFGTSTDPGGRASVPLDLSAQDQMARATLAVKGRLALDAGRFEGLDAAVALRAPALAALRPLVSHALPALTDVALDGRLAVPADARSFALQGAKLTAREGDLAGEAKFGPAGFGGTLHSSRLELDAVLAAFGVSLAMAPRPTDGPMISDAPLPWAMLRGSAVTLDATVAALGFQHQVWRDVKLGLRLDHGRLQVSPLQVALPGGPAALSLIADATGEAGGAAVPVSLELHAPGIPLALITRYAGLPGEATGGLRVDAQLRAAGRSARELAASLDGMLAATMTGGSLANAALLKLAAAALEALGVKVPPDGQTAIQCFGVVGGFSKGVGRFPTIALSTDAIQFDGAGQVDLGTETLALKLHPLAQISGSPVSVPVLIEGPFRALQGRLDASGLDKLGLLIDGWFGGDRPDTCSDAGLVAAKR